MRTLQTSKSNYPDILRGWGAMTRWACLFPNEHIKQLSKSVSFQGFCGVRMAQPVSVVATRTKKPRIAFTIRGNQSKLWRGTLPWGESFRTPVYRFAGLTHDNQNQRGCGTGVPNAQTMFCSCSNPVLRLPPFQIGATRRRHRPCRRTDNAYWPFCRPTVHRSIQRFSRECPVCWP